MSQPSPTSWSLGILRGHGAWTVQVVEHWNPHARVRQDLFGFADVLAVGPWGTLAVQATSAEGVATRLAKLRDLDAVGHCLRAGWRVEVWGRRRKPDRYGDTLKARSLLLEVGGRLRVSEASHALALVTTATT